MRVHSRNRIEDRNEIGAIMWDMILVIFVFILCLAVLYYYQGREIQELKAENLRLSRELNKAKWSLRKNRL